MGCLSSSLLSGDHAIDGLSLLQLLLHLHHQLDAVDHQLHLLHLGGAQTVSVGDVEHAAHGGRVHTTWRTKDRVKRPVMVHRSKRALRVLFCSTCATFLQTQPSQDLLELGVCAELGQLDVHAATQAGSQVGGAGQDVAQVLVPHEAMIVLLEDLLNLTRGEKTEVVERLDAQ